MKLELLPQRFSICKLSEAPSQMVSWPLCFYARSEQEISLVCPESLAPEDALSREDGWRCFRIAGTLDFSLIGILSKITGILAEQRVGVFVVSTYLTDYVLLREGQWKRGLEALRSGGYEMEAWSGDQQRGKE